MALITEHIPSPNHSSRHGAAIEATIIHYTAAGCARGSVLWFAQMESRVSAHFVISRHGTITQCVDLQRAAWHCGVAELVVDGEARSNPNDITIGIELANCGFIERVEGEWCYRMGDAYWPYGRTEPVQAALRYDSGAFVDGYWEPYPDAQIDALQALLLTLAANDSTAAAAQNLVGHEEIAMPMGRRRDPGPLFPWDRFLRKTPRRTQAIV